MSSAMARVFLPATLIVLASATTHAPGGAASAESHAVESAAPATSHDPPGKGAWLDYDFVPGGRTIWLEDFSSDTVGAFPHRMELVGGTFAVIGVAGRHVLRTADGGMVTIALPESLPQRFTVEVQYHVNQDDNPLAFHTSAIEAPVLSACEFGCSLHAAYVDCGGKRSSATTAIPDEHALIDARFAIDGKVVKAYVNGKRVANVSDALIARTSKIQLQLPGATEDDPTLVASIRIAESGKPLYAELSASGRVATQGILFEAGSDQIRAESTPTLKEIGEMLKAHPTLKLVIEDHTDNLGAEDANLALSGRRAAAVRSYLLTSYGIADARLKAKGLGASKPIAPSTTAEGRRDNRRVELVKI